MRHGRGGAAENSNCFLPVMASPFAAVNPVFSVKMQRSPGASWRERCQDQILGDTHEALPVMPAQSMLKGAGASASPSLTMSALNIACTSR